MKIDKLVKGFKFRYHVDIIPNAMECDVRFFKSDEPTTCKITEDFKYVLLPDSITVYITDIGKVPVGKLKLNKRQQFEAKEYNEKYLKQL